MVFPLFPSAKCEKRPAIPIACPVSPVSHAVAIGNRMLIPLFENAHAENSLLRNTCMCDMAACMRNQLLSCTVFLLSLFSIEFLPPGLYFTSISSLEASWDRTFVQLAFINTLAVDILEANIFLLSAFRLLSPLAYSCISCSGHRETHVDSPFWQRTSLRMYLMQWR